MEKMEKALYEKVFLKHANIQDVIKEALTKHIKFVIFANMRFTLVHNCIIKARDEKLFKEDLDKLNRYITEICIYLDKIIEIIEKVLTTKK